MLAVALGMQPAPKNSDFRIPVTLNLIICGLIEKVRKQ